MRKTVRNKILLILSCLCLTFSLASFILGDNFSTAKAESERVANNVDFYDGFEEYSVGTELKNLTSKYVLGPHSIETVELDPTNAENKVLHVSNTARTYFEIKSVITRNFTASYRFYATRRVEWIGLNVRRAESGGYATFDSMKSYFNLVRIGYNPKLTDNKTIRYSPQVYNRSAYTKLEEVVPSDNIIEKVYDSAYNSWHEFSVQYIDNRIIATLDGDVIFDLDYDANWNEAGYFSFAFQDADVYLDDITVTTEDKYTIKVNNKEEAGKATVNRSTASENSTILLKAIPKDGFEFDGWYENDTLLSKDLEFTVATKTTSDRVFSTKWITEVYNVSVDSLDSKRGAQQITLDGVKVNSCNALSTLKATAVALENYEFSAWYSDGKVVSTENPYLFTMPIYDYKLSAKYVLKGTEKCQVNVVSQTKDTVSTSGSTSSSAGGTVYGGGTYHKGIDLCLTAVENDRYTFDGWYKDEQLISNDLELNVVSSNQTYTAKFKDRLYSLTLINGVDEKSTSLSYVYGTTFRAMPVTAIEGYVFRGWYVENAEYEVQEDNKLILKVEQQNVVAKATYTKLRRNVAVSSQQKGVGATGGGNKEFGEIVTVKPMNTNEYVVKGYKVTGAVGTINEDGTLTFVMPNNDVKVEVQFQYLNPTPILKEIIGRVFFAVVVLALFFVVFLRFYKRKNNKE